jgi:hypothetical protein
MRMQLTYLTKRVGYRLYELTHPKEPWIAQGAVRYLDQNLNKNWVGIEWGSGRSTIWFARRLNTLLSIEHNEKWYRLVSSTLSANAECRLIPLNHLEREPTKPIYDPLPDYVAVVNELDQINFAVVDGHYRQACIRATLPKLSAGGLLVVDNTDWLPIEKWGVPREWPIIHQSRNVMTQTTIWKKT